MSKLQSLESEVRGPGCEDLAAFRRCFAEFAADAWDAQIEADVTSGRLNALAERALREHEVGQATEL